MQLEVPRLFSLYVCSTIDTSNLMLWMHNAACVYKVNNSQVYISAYMDRLTESHAEGTFSN